MNNPTREVAWAGLAHTTEEQDTQLVANILKHWGPVRQEELGPFIVQHYEVANEPFIVITSNGKHRGRRLGFGLPMSEGRDTERSIWSARSFLSLWRIPGLRNISIFKLCSGPVRVE